MRPRRLSPARRPHGGYSELGPLVRAGHRNREGGIGLRCLHLSLPSLPSCRAPRPPRKPSERVSLGQI